jgi:membrane fusion protein (multidrug efflux system)
MYKLSRILIYFSLVPGMLACSGNASDKKVAVPPIPVTTVNVSLTQAVFYNYYPANIVALKEVELRGQVTGYVTGMFFTEGKRFIQGRSFMKLIVASMKQLIRKPSQM